MKMTHFPFRSFCLLICSGIVTGSLFSQESKAPVVKSREVQKSELLAKYDHNKNGVLDPDEVERIGRDRLLRWDKNKDGKMDQADFKTMRAQSIQMPKQDLASREKAIAQANFQMEIETERLKKAAESKAKSKESVEKKN